MRNLRKFNSEADYSAATLNYPAVSWVTGIDAVHFDKAAPADLSKVMMAFQSTTAGKDVVLWNGGASVPPTDLFTDLTVNDVDVMGLLDAGATLTSYTEPDTTYVVKYGLLAEQITDIFSGDLGGGWGSSVGSIEFFVPSSVSSIESLPGNTGTLVIDNETVPSISIDFSGMNSINLYVPDNAVSAYQTALGAYWKGNILPMSQYSGNLPI